MHKIHRLILMIVMLLLTLLVSACKSETPTTGIGGLPLSIENNVLNQAEEGSQIVSVQQGSKTPTDSEQVKPEDVWCVVSETSDGTRMRWLGFYRLPEEDGNPGLSMVTKGADRSLFTKFGCNNYDLP